MSELEQPADKTKQTDADALRDITRAAPEIGPSGKARVFVSTPRGGPDDPRQNHDSSPETGPTS